MDKIKKTFALAGVVALLAPAAAFAQASNEAYGGDGDVVAGLESGSGDEGPSGGATNPTTPTTSEGDSLPFTGSDLGVLAAAGGALLGLGFGLRRMTHRPHGA